MASPIEPLDVGGLHSAVVDRLGRDIVTGGLPVGSTIAAEPIADDFGVSRTVIREAVRVLESLGLVTVRRRVGITVQPAAHWSPYDSRVLRWRLAGPDRVQQLRHLSEIRAAIEPIAARLAAQRAEPDQCGALSAAVIGMSVTARAANASDYLAHDIAFHTTLLTASGNPMMAGLVDMVTAVLTGRTAHDLMPVIAEPEAVRLHGVAAAAIQSGDADGAERAMAAIVTESSEAIQALARPDRSG